MRALMLATLAALAVTEARADDEARPNLERVERMAENAAERFEGCCRGQAFERAARRAWLREQQRKRGRDEDAPRVRVERLELRELPEFDP